MKAKSKRVTKDGNAMFTNGLLYITGHKHRGRAKKQFHSYLKACETSKYLEGAAAEWLTRYSRDGFKPEILGDLRTEFNNWKARSKTPKKGKQGHMLRRSKDGRFLGPSVTKSPETTLAILKLAEEKRESGP
jgi:hypothetical protein